MRGEYKEKKYVLIFNLKLQLVSPIQPFIRMTTMAFIGPI